MPEGGKRTSLSASYTWGQQGLETQFRDVYQPGQGIFSPGYPLAPLEPERVRVWDYPVGVNTIYTPRSYEPVSFDELRRLAEAHDITRLAIETRNFKGPRTYENSGIRLHDDNQSVVKERIFLDKANPDLLRMEITTIDHALTRPWTITKTFRPQSNTFLVLIGKRLQYRQQPRAPLAKQSMVFGIETLIDRVRHLIGVRGHPFTALAVFHPPFQAEIVGDSK